MEPVQSTRSIFLAFVSLTILQLVCSQNVYVAAPNTFRVGEPETVVVYSHSGVQKVTVSLADAPGKRKIFYTRTVDVDINAPQIIQVKVGPEHIPDLSMAGASEPHYVFLMVKGRNFNKEVKVRLTLHSGYVFIQTDKPIYNPTQPVNIRILRLNEAMEADKTPFTLQIRNPQNTIVHSVSHKELDSMNGMYSSVYNFTNFPLYGEWSVVVLYGLKKSFNSTVKIELRKYVLPTFDIEVNVPEVILPEDKNISVSLTAQYVYGMKVDGIANIKLKVKIPTGHVEQFKSCKNISLVDGKAECSVTTQKIQDNENLVWFPGLAGARLVVEALVYERSSGYLENRTVDSTIFSQTPHIINFRKSLTTYVPGLNTAITVQIKHVNGNPAPNVEAAVTIHDQNNDVIAIETSVGVTNDEGLVAFVVKTKESHKSLSVKVETRGQKQSVTGDHVMFPYTSPNNAYVGISRDAIFERKIRHFFTTSVFSHPDKNMVMSYLVKSKGKILRAGSLFQEGNHQRSINFRITADMIPSARVVLFGSHGDQLLVDSLKIGVEKTCNPNGKVKVKVTSKRSTTPGSEVNVEVSGPENTVVGILAVDKAVYALRNKDKLTKDKMFSEMEKHDMGCGAGGGADSPDVSANAGIILISDKLSLLERKSCVERKLMKRAIRDCISNNSECCEWGQQKDLHSRTCEARAETIRNFAGPLHDREECARVFLECCLNAAETVTRSKVRNLDATPKYPSSAENEDDEIEESLMEAEERKDFRETWLFEIEVIGSSGVLSQSKKLPDSITTWIVQVVGLSTNGGGMCVAEPFKVVAYKDFFLDVKMPHSVVRNERIEIPVTIFNYGSKTSRVMIYMHGVDGICSEAPPGRKGEKKRITVKNGTAETIAFQMIPLEARPFPITFTAGSSSSGSDNVTKTLNVIPKGIAHQEPFYITLDPSNSENRKKREIHNGKYEEKFDNARSKQLLIVELKPELEFVVPGTEYVVVEAIGDTFGPTIQTSLENPDALLRLPHGCGEQNMAYTAPTIYTFHYLKATGKATPQQEANALKFIREGVTKQQTYRKRDGSFAVWRHSPPSTWLTTFTAKVFCQAAQYINVDENMLCSALKWIVTKQKDDGSFVESHDIYHKEMKGGITGDVPLTAFVVMAFTKCSCKSEDLKEPLEKAIKYLRAKSAVIEDFYPLAISTYALALYDAESAKDSNRILMGNVSFDESLNRRYWGDGTSARSIEASSYGLLAQVLLRNLDTATSVVNFLNAQRKFGGTFWSTQDTVAAIEALSEYSIFAKKSNISLLVNVTATSDLNFTHTWQFDNNNARVRRHAQLNKFGGKLNVEVQGNGSGLFGVTLHYNVKKHSNQSSLCKFEVSVAVSSSKENEEIPEPPNKDDRPNPDVITNRTICRCDDRLNPTVTPTPPKKDDKDYDGGIDSPDIEAHDKRGLEKRDVDINMEDVLASLRGLNMTDRRTDRRNDHLIDRPADGPVDRSNDSSKSGKYVLKVKICSRYLRNEDSNMVIVDVGMLTGFKPISQDLLSLVYSNTSLVDHFEESGRNLIFYLEKMPRTKSHCFSFRIERKFIASNLESGLVRVYDYYNPDGACSQFYRSKPVGPPFSVNCVQSICKCAEGTSTPGEQ